MYVESLMLDCFLGDFITKLDNIMSASREWDLLLFYFLVALSMMVGVVLVVL